MDSTLTPDLARRMDLSGRVTMARHCIESAIEALNTGRSYAAKEELTELLRWLDAEEARDQAANVGIAIKPGEYHELVFGGPNLELVEIRRV